MRTYMVKSYISHIVHKSRLQIIIRRKHIMYMEKINYMAKSYVKNICHLLVIKCLYHIFEGPTSNYDLN